MTRMAYMMAALIVAGLLGTTPVDAQQAGTVGSSITLNTCVERGQENDTYVLTNLVDVPAHPRTYGKVVYWVDKVSALRKNVGNQVRIRGTIKDVEQDEIEVKLNEGDGGSTVVEIEGPQFQVKTSPVQADVSDRGQTVPERKIPTTLVKVKLQELTVVSTGCQASTSARR